MFNVIVHCLTDAARHAGHADISATKSTVP